ncbi:uncharacterized protein LOC143896231 isoform X1 [Temnothorax americanus]|uniref:uncharacterized protein LOC143896231 isoform X1 n=3 Tax=Temnothorax americanus TaxID=1964332 RepID=UPI00406791FE
MLNATRGIEFCSLVLYEILGYFTSQFLFSHEKFVYLLLRLKIIVTSIMDNTVEKTSDIERKATLNKLRNMQWLKSTSHSANPEKVKAVVYKQAQKRDEDKKIEDEVLAVTETVKKLLGRESNKYFSTDDTCETHSCDDAMPESDENVWSKNIDTANLFPNADELADQKNEEDMLSIVESIVTAKVEAEFCINKEQEDQSSTSENNAEDVVRDAVTKSSSDSRKTDGGAKEMKLIHSDGNNNDSKSITPCTSKVNDKQKSTCKITSTESGKPSTEPKDKDVRIRTSNITKAGIKTGGNTNLAKDNEKFSRPSNDSKKAVSNSSKSLSTPDKIGRDHFNNKQNNTKNTRRQEFVKRRNVPRNAIEKETKNAAGKPNVVKTVVETADATCQNKNLNRDEASQKLQQTTPKQFASKSKRQDSLRKNTSNFSDDKNKTENAAHTPENVDSPLNETERKNEKIVCEKNAQSDQRANRSIDCRKNTFVAQYKNSAYSKPTQNIPRHAAYGRNPSYAYTNPRFDRDRNGSAERRIPKREHTPVNTFVKSDTGTEEPNTSNLENCAKQKKEIIQPINVKSISACIDLAFNDRKDIKPVKVETQSKENTNSSVAHPERELTTSEAQQCRVETSDILKVESIDQQDRDMKNEETDLFKHSSFNLTSDEYSTNSQFNDVTHQYSVKLENMRRTNDVNQFESSQAAWDQPSDNAEQKGATVMSVQQSIQNMHLNTQQTFTQAGNPTRQMSPWELNGSKFYDQQFSVSDAMRLSQIPNTFSALPYEYNAPISNDNNVTATSTLETTMSNNRENSNVLYRYEPNVQQRSVMASDYPDHSLSPCQTNQARWSTSVQDGFHVEHPYIAAQPAMMHVYNPAAFGLDDFNNAHTVDYVSHPVMYAPYMQTWNSQLQYAMPVLYNSPCANYTTFSQASNQPNNFNNVHDQQQKHNPYAQMNSCVRDTHDTNTCAVQAQRNTADNVPAKSNYYYKKYQDNRTVYDVPQYVPPVSYSRSQQGMNVMPATGINQYNASYCSPNQRHYRQNVSNYMKKNQDFAYDDNGSAEDIPPIISPKEFVTDNISLSNKTDQFATRVFKPEFRMKPNLGYRPPSSFPRGGFRRNTTLQDFPKEYTYPVSIGRGTYKTKRT